jgi:hypothetical protein
MHKQQAAERAQLKQLLGLVRKLDEDVHKLVEAKGKEQLSEPRVPESRTWREADELPGDERG